MSQDQLFQLEQQNQQLLQQISNLEFQVSTLTQSDQNLKLKIQIIESESQQKTDQVKDSKQKVIELENVIKLKETECQILQACAQESEINFRNEINVNKSYQQQVQSLSQELSDMKLQVQNLEGIVLSYKHTEDKQSFLKSQMEQSIASQKEDTDTKSNDLINYQRELLKENQELKAKIQDQQSSIDELKAKEQKVDSEFQNLRQKHQNLEKLYKNKKFQLRNRLKKMEQEYEKKVKKCQEVEEKLNQRQRDSEEKERQYFRQFWNLDKNNQNLKDQLNTLTIEYYDCNQTKQELYLRVQQLEKQVNTVLDNPVKVDIAPFQSKITETQQKLQEEQITSLKLKKMLDELMQELNSKTSASNQQKKDYEELYLAYNQLLEKLKSQELEKTAIYHQNLELKNKIKVTEELKQQYYSMQDQANQLLSQSLLQKSPSDQSLLSIQDILSQLQTLKYELSKLRSENYSLRNLQIQDQEKEQTIQSQQDQISRQQKEIERLAQVIQNQPNITLSGKELLAQLNQLQFSVSNQQQENRYEEIEQLFSSQSQELLALKSEKSQIKIEYKYLSSKVQQLEQIKQCLQDQVNQHQKDKGLLEQALQNAQFQLTQVNTQNIQKTFEIDQLKMQVQNLDQQIKVLKSISTQERVQQQLLIQSNKQVLESNKNFEKSVLLNREQSQQMLKKTLEEKDALFKRYNCLQQEFSEFKLKSRQQLAKTKIELENKNNFIQTFNEKQAFLFSDNADQSKNPKIAQLQKEVQAYQEENQKLKELMDQIQAESQNLNIQKELIQNQKKEEYQKYLRILKQHKERSQILKERILMENEEILYYKILSQRVKELESTLNEEKQNLQLELKKRESTQNKSKKLIEQIQENKKKITLLEQDCNQYQSQLNLKSTQKQENEEKLQKVIENLQQQIQKQTENNQTEQELEGQKLNEEQQLSQNQLIQWNQQYKQQIDQLQEQMQSLQNDNARYQNNQQIQQNQDETYLQVQKSLEEAQGELQITKLQNQQLKQQIDEMKQTVDAKEKIMIKREQILESKVSKEADNEKNIQARQMRDIAYLIFKDTTN